LLLALILLLSVSAPAHAELEQTGLASAASAHLLTFTLSGEHTRSAKMPEHVHMHACPSGGSACKGCSSSCENCVSGQVLTKCGLVPMSPDESTTVTGYCRLLSQLDLTPLLRPPWVEA